MDPSNVFKHCYNSFCLSLTHNKPICHFWQHSGVKKGADDPRGIAMVYCARCLEMCAGVFVLCSMDLINVLDHSCDNDCFSPCLTTSPFAIFGNTPESKRGQMTQEVWPWCVVPGVLKCVLVCLCCVPWTISMF